MLKELLDYLHYKLQVFPLVGVELEFYFENIVKGDLDLLINQIKDGCKKLRSISANLTKEQGDLQYEIQTSCYTDIINLINNVKFIQEILTENAENFQGKVSFLAKPYLTKPGSAFHVHINLLDKENNNLFYNLNNKMSHYLSYGIGGLCSSMKKNMIYFAPHENSYLRYQHADIDTPTTISWGGNNRTTAIRMPNCTDNPEAYRLEHRVAGTDANYEQVITAILHGIIYGIECRIDPPTKVYGVAADPQYNLEKLPLTLNEAKRCHKEILL